MKNLFDVFIRAGIILIILRIIGYGINIHYIKQCFSKLDNSPIYISPKLDSCKNYIVDYVNNNDNILNKESIICHINNCRTIIYPNIIKNATAQYIYWKIYNKNYINFLDSNNAENTFTIIHEYLHLVDLRSLKKTKIIYDSIINYNLTKEEFVNYYISMLELSSDTSLKNINYFEELYDKTIGSNKDYYYSDSEIYVRIKLLAFFIENCLDKKVTVNRLTSNFLDLIDNGQFILILNDHWKNEFFNSDFVMILPALKRNMYQINLII